MPYNNKLMQLKIIEILIIIWRRIDEKSYNIKELQEGLFYQVDKMNKILADGGSDKKWTAETYVRDQFEKAIKNTMLRQEDKVVK